MKIQTNRPTLVEVHKTTIRHIKDNKNDVEEYIKETSAYKVQVQRAENENVTYNSYGKIK